MRGSGRVAVSMRKRCLALTDEGQVSEAVVDSKSPGPASSSGGAQPAKLAPLTKQGQQKLATESAHKDALMRLFSKKPKTES